MYFYLILLSLLKHKTKCINKHLKRNFITHISGLAVFWALGLIAWRPLSRLWTLGSEFEPQSDRLKDTIGEKDLAAYLRNVPLPIKNRCLRLVSAMPRLKHTVKIKLSQTGMSSTILARWKLGRKNSFNLRLVVYFTSFEVQHEERGDKKINENRIHNHRVPQN